MFWKPKISHFLFLGDSCLSCWVKDWLWWASVLIIHHSARSLHYYYLDNIRVCHFLLQNRSMKLRMKKLKINLKKCLKLWTSHNNPLCNYIFYSWDNYFISSRLCTFFFVSFFTFHLLHQVFSVFFLTFWLLAFFRKWPDVMFCQLLVWI